MAAVYLLMGTNLGDKLNNLAECQAHLLAHNIGITLESRTYRTKAWGFEEQPEFFNKALQITTSYLPNELLIILKEIENEMGRIEIGRWKERLIDIDILYYDNDILNSINLIIPHPQIQFRRFTLVPLQDIAGDFIHPILNKSNNELLEECPDNLEVELVQ